jgi:hypothetical protein
MRFLLSKIVPLVALAAVLPSAAFGQASVTGVVRDASGGVLPGVTVEASSPALLEKVRASVTDGTGQYRIENLRPGPYTLTFVLPGFSTVKHEGLELTGSFTATVNVELRVGALEETITVTADTPIVDVQSTTRQRVLDHEVMDAIPTGRSDKNLAMLIPGVNIAGAISQDVGGTQDQVSSQLTVHGTRGGDQRLTQNGVSLGITANGANTLIVAVNLSAYQEVTIDTGAVSAEMPTGGVRVNYIPKDGGNTFAGTMTTSFGNESMQSDNFTSELQTAGLGTPSALKRVWDINPGIGGPVMRDLLWFHVAYKDQKNEYYPAGIFTNRNANDPTAWTYVPDPTSRPFNSVDGSDFHARLTWQAAPKLKIGFSSQDSGYCACSDGISATTAPEAALFRKSVKQRNLMGDWTAPLTNRLLVDGAFIHRHQDQRREVPPGNDNPLMISVTEQALGNLVYRTVNNAGANPALRVTWFSTMFIRSAVSYITGAHAFRAGFTFGNGNEVNWLGNPLVGSQQVAYRFNNGVPNQITLYGYPLRTEYTTNSDSGVFVQDKWTINRLTASYGVRYDHFSNSAPESVAGPTILLPNRNVVFPATDGVSWKDLTPKVGVAYDLFGTGKTALKASLNKYVQGMGSNDGFFGAAIMPANRVGNTTTRSWNDANRDYVPNCDLAAPAANGECGAMANQNFGGSTPGASYDPDVLSGWGVRAFNWEFSTGVQQEVLPRVSVDVSYFRRWYGNFFVADNRAVTPADVTAFNVTAPSTDTRLPTSGQVISGYYDLNPNKVGLVDNYITKASNYGKQTEHWNGVDVTMSARLRNGLLVQGGTSTGRTSTNHCEIRDKLPEASLTNPFCDVATPFLTQVKFLAAYTVPRIDVQLSGTLQNIPGPVANANYVVASALVAPSLGRPLSGNAANVTVSLIEPNSLYGDRINQVDLRVGKILRFGRVRTGVNLDVFNALNSAAVLAVNNSFGGTTPWQRPQSILQARLVKISLQADF